MRELDWRIHELMGNDLTGWEWANNEEIYFVVRDFGYGEGIGRVSDVLRKTIPHYSTTWEGAGLVMEWLMKNEMSFEIGRSVLCREDYIVEVESRFEHDHSLPLALAKAYISAMEERDNG